MLNRSSRKAVRIEAVREAQTFNLCLQSVNDKVIIRTLTKLLSEDIRFNRSDCNISWKVSYGQKLDFKNIRKRIPKNDKEPARKSRSCRADR